MIRASSEPSERVSAYKAVTVHTKVKSVLRLLQGENEEVVADELGVSLERLLSWKERFVEGGRAGLLRRRTDDTARSQKRNQTLAQWSGLVITLLLAIWLIIRIMANMQRGA